MRVRKFILLTIGFFLFFNVQAHKPNGFEITGHLGGLAEGKKIFLTIVEAGNWNFGKSDTAFVKNGEFHFSGIVPEGPRYYFIELDRTDTMRRHQIISLLIDNGEKIKITSDSGNVLSIKATYIERYCKIEGSPSNDALYTMFPIYQLYCQTINSYRNELKKIKDSIGFEPSLIGLTMNIMNKESDILYFLFLRNCYDGTLPKSAIPFQIISYKLYEWANHPHWLMDIYNSLDEATKSSYYGKILKEYALLSVGQRFPEFELSTSDGKMLALKDIVAKSKVTIVHFWADNSIQRAQLQEELRVFYKKYHEKGLNIIGVSSDKYADQWKDALKRYQYPWVNVSDMKGIDGIVEKVYHEYSNEPNQPINNTTNVLIDNQGKIIAWDVSGPELQWYLLKYFEETNSTNSTTSKTISY